jgi:hypothetical protein
MFIEKLFYKKRNIYKYSHSVKSFNVEVPKGFTFKVINSEEKLKQDDFGSIFKNIGLFSFKKVSDRLARNTFVLFFLYHNESKSIAASYWAFIPKNNNSWYDTFKINTNEALLCNAFVEKEFRRQGLYTYLVKTSHEWIIQNRMAKRVYTIVEQSNKKSDSVNRTFYSKPYCVNHLYKLLSFNIVSSLKNDHKIVVYFVPFGLTLYES